MVKHSPTILACRGTAATTIFNVATVSQPYNKRVYLIVSYCSFGFQDQLRDMYHVVFQFSKLTGKFVDDVQNQVVWRGRDSSDYESFDSLNTMLWWMKYVIAELRRLV